MGSSSEEDAGFFKEDTKDTKAEEKIPKFENFTTDKNNICIYCKNSDVDNEILTVFKILICKKCKFEKLKLITKTTCRDEYLLDDTDFQNFKYLTRKNPHKGHWSSMCLYLEEEIKEHAIKKYGSLEEIERIKYERVEKLMEIKKNRMKKKIRENRRKTRVIEIPDKVKHVHEFQKIGNVVKCSCGLEYEEEEI